jgi:hypothetical protein
LPTSSAFRRAVRTSSVKSATCLLAFLNCFPAFLTSLATSLSPDPVPGIFTPRTFFGLLPSRVPRMTPPTSPAAAVATPVTTATFPFAPAFELRALSPDDGADEPRLREAALRLREDAELRPRDEAAEERGVEALALFGLLREADDLLFEDPLRLLLFELLAWAIAPPSVDAPRSRVAYPDRNRANAWGTACTAGNQSTPTSPEIPSEARPPDGDRRPGSVGSVASAWVELARLMEESRAATVTDLDREAVAERAEQLWVVPPGGSLL